MDDIVKRLLRGIKADDSTNVVQFSASPVSADSAYHRVDLARPCTHPQFRRKICKHVIAVRMRRAQ